MSDSFVDIIGKVEDANTIKMYRVSNWGESLGKPNCLVLPPPSNTDMRSI